MPGLRGNAPTRTAMSILVNASTWSVEAVIELSIGNAQSYYSKINDLFYGEVYIGFYMGKSFTFNCILKYILI